VFADFVSAHVVFGVSAVVVSLFAYFFYIVAAFTAISVLLIGLFNNSTLEKVRHHPRPVIERRVTAIDTEARHRLIVPGTSEGSAAKNAPAKDVKDTPGVTIAKTGTGKTKRESSVHLHKLARQWKNFEGHGYTHALGYAEETGYRAGLDSQR
jgi:hypothetical protein